MTTLIVAAVLVTVATVYAATLVLTRTSHRTAALVAVERPDGVPQWRARTPHGDVIVTEVLHPDKGRCYAATTYFRGHPPATQYLPPSLVLTQAWVDALLTGSGIAA